MFQVDSWTGIEQQLVPSVSSYNNGSTHYSRRHHYYVEKDEFMIRFHRVDTPGSFQYHSPHLLCNLEQQHEHITSLVPNLFILILRALRTNSGGSVKASRPLRLLTLLTHPQSISSLRW